MLKNYWGEAVLTATHLINRLPTQVLDYNSPMQLFLKFFPNFKTTNHLVPKVFGHISFIHIHSNNCGKLDLRAPKCVFVEYSSTQKWYKCNDPPTKRFFVSIDVTFSETENYFPNPYLQVETSFMEDKDRDLFLLDLSSFPSLQNQNPPSFPSLSISILLPNELDPSTPSFGNKG